VLLAAGGRREAEVQSSVVFGRKKFRESKISNRCRREGNKLNLLTEQSESRTRNIVQRVVDKIDFYLLHKS
jgi:hypothetical protein